MCAKINILYFFVSGMGNIAQGGDPLQASVDQKWSCRGQIKPILMRFFAKSPFPDGIGERLFFGPLIFTFLGVRETFFRRLRHFSRNSVPFPGIRCYHQFIIFYQQSPLNDNTTTMIHCFYFQIQLRRRAGWSLYKKLSLSSSALIKRNQNYQKQPLIDTRG